MTGKREVEDLGGRRDLGGSSGAGGLVNAGRGCGGAARINSYRVAGDVCGRGRIGVPIRRSCALDANLEDAQTESRYARTSDPDGEKRIYREFGDSTANVRLRRQTVQVTRRLRPALRLASLA